MITIAIFASGKGSNAQSIIEYFIDNEQVKVGLILSNRKNSGVLDLADKFDIPKIYFPKQRFYDNDGVVSLLKQNKIDAIILAGFLLKIPSFLLNTYPDGILNIHPSLLPKYGGKGMYGEHVHNAVFENNDIETGITIHLVNEHYDEGKILFQASTEIISDDGPEEIAAKVLEIEHYYYPRVIEAFLENDLNADPVE